MPSIEYVIFLLSETYLFRTSEYECTREKKVDGKTEPGELVVRRGDNIKMTLTFDRPYNKEKHDMELCFYIGEFNFSLLCLSLCRFVFILLFVCPYFCSLCLFYLFLLILSLFGRIFYFVYICLTYYMYLFFFHICFFTYLFYIFVCLFVCLLLHVISCFHS